MASDDARDGSIVGQNLSTGSGMKLPDQGEQQIQDAHNPGLASDQYAAAGYGMESQADANQSNALFNAYFAPLESQYGLNQQQLVSAFQNNAVPAAQQQSLLSGEQAYANSVLHPDTWYDKLFGQLALATSVGVATAGVGGLVGPALGSMLGSTAGGIATGAVSGATGGALSSALQGQNVGKGALIGGVSGGVGAAASPLVSSLVNDGIPAPIASALVKGGTGAATGAIGAAVNGGSALQGAESGAEHSALNSATGAIAGSVFGSGNTIFSSGQAADPTQDTNLSQPTSPSNFNMGDDLNDPSPFDSSGQTSDNNFGFDPSSLGTPDQGYLNSAINSGATQDASSAWNGLSMPNGSGGASTNPLASLLSKLLGGSSNSALQSIGAGLGSNNGLAQLLGLGSTALGGALNSQAAQYAAQNYGAQTSFNPYSVNTANGSTSFNGNNLTSSLSPGQQANVNSLNGLTQQSAGALQAGPGAAANQYYQQLQQQQQQGNNLFYQNNLDSQMANGVLSSTAGQYQSQAALNSINQQNANDAVLANNFANTQQQNQLSQLTAGLNGLSGINQQQLSSGQLAGQLGVGASNANLAAYQPLLATNANSNAGNFFSALGNSGQTNSQNPFSAFSGFSTPQSSTPVSH